MMHGVLGHSVHYLVPGGRTVSMDIQCQLVQMLSSRFFNILRLIKKAQSLYTLGIHTLSSEET